MMGNPLPVELGHRHRLNYETLPIDQAHVETLSHVCDSRVSVESLQSDLCRFRSETAVSYPMAK